MTTQTMEVKSIAVSLNPDSWNDHVARAIDETISPFVADGFDVVSVQPIQGWIKTPFAEVSALKVKLTLTEAGGKPIGRNILLWMSDDARRLPMKLQADLPIGSFNLTLRDAK